MRCCALTYPLFAQLALVAAGRDVPNETRRSRSESAANSKPGLVALSLASAVRDRTPIRSSAQARVPTTDR